MAIVMINIFDCVLQSVYRLDSWLALPVKTSGVGDEAHWDSFGEEGSRAAAAEQSGIVSYF